MLIIERQRLVQFLMVLSNDFDGLRSSIICHSPIPSVDSVVHELLTHEIYLQSRSLKPPEENLSVMQLHSRPTFDFRNKPILKVANDEYYFCKKNGHCKAQCPLLNKKGRQQ